MATVATLRRIVSANKTFLTSRKEGPLARTVAAACASLADVFPADQTAASLPSDHSLGGRRLRHDTARTGRRFTFDYDGLSSVHGAPPSSSYDRGLRGRRSRSDAAREELLEQLGATGAPPSSPSPAPRSSRSSARRLRRAVTPVPSAVTTRTRRRRKRRPAAEDASSPYARPLSLRGRDGASPNGWSRLVESTDDDDESDVVARLRVKSVHAANSIDVADVLSKVFGGGAAVVRAEGFRGGGRNLRSLRHVFGKTSLVVQLPPASVAMDDDDAAASNRQSSSDHSLPRYVAVFRFGSVVFFNVSAKDAGRILQDVKRSADATGGDPVASGFERRENFEVAVRPDMDRVAHANGDYATVRDLNMHSVAVVGTIMAQTVAIDSYSDTVDELLASFEGINSSVKKTGNIRNVEKGGLFKAVALNNSLSIDMIGKLGIKDRSDTAWNLSQYERVWDDLREEFEIDGRFSQIEFKLDLIQRNAKFFLEMLNHQKSNSLEWIIVVLIGFECALMCLEMSGMGEAAFATLPWDSFPLSLPPPK